MVGQEEDASIMALAQQAVALIGDKDSFVFIKDQQHRYVSCNDNYARFLGLDDDKKIIGLTDRIINPQHAVIYRLDDERVLRGETLNIDNPAFFASVGLVNVIGKIIPLKNASNNIAGILGTTKLIFTIANKPFYQVFALLNAQTIPIIVSKKWYAIHTRYGQVKLSKREVECMLFLFKSMTSDAIANSLQLSQRSVESYFVNIKNKLQVKHKSEMLEAVIIGGLLEQL